MGIRHGLEHRGKGGSNKQILSFGAWARRFAFAVIFNPDNLFHKADDQGSKKSDTITEKHVTHLYP